MAEKFVKDAISLTDTEALEANVINQRVTDKKDLAKALAKVIFCFAIGRSILKNETSHSKKSKTSN
jgi:membrane-bound ClpP family serine protease